MKTFLVAVTATLLTAAPLLAQGTRTSPGEAGGYVMGLTGFATSSSNTTGAAQIEGGVRIARHVKLFADVGRFANLKGDLQPTLDATTAALSANQGLSVIGTGKLPATYLTSGLRVEVPAGTRVMPYVLGSVGMAHLSPAPTFTFSSGALPDGSTPNVGTDVTAQLTSAGTITVPPASWASMFTFGAGVEIPVAKRWHADAGYRYSHIAADSTLSASPLTTNGMAFGLGYRF